MFSYLVFVVSYYFLFSRADARDTRAEGERGGAHKERRRRTRKGRKEEDAWKGQRMRDGRRAAQSRADAPRHRGGGGER